MSLAPSGLGNGVGFDRSRDSEFFRINPQIAPYGGFEFKVPDGLDISPFEFDRLVAGLPDDLRSGFLLSIQDVANSRNRALEGQGLAVDTLRGAQDRIGVDRRNFLDDPNRLAIQNVLAARASGRIPTITGTQRASALNQIQQDYARNLAVVRGQNAQRGQAGSSGGTEAILRSTTDASGVSLGASIDAANQGGRDAALSSLAGFQDATNEFTSRLGNESDRISAAIADVQNGVVVDPIDFQSGSGLAFARDQFESQLAITNRQLDLLEREGDIGTLDWINLAFDAAGSGFLAPVLNFFTQLGKGN